ncbi:hypothetical protein FRC11_002435 [Ceratobasidium sp. 423]|nr:hypothetical protein FRC11_002435 [Ceratobasidium sp. 423]
MPADTKRKCTESTCKCEGRESTKADKRDHKNKKITAKAHKTHCEEAKEDDLLMECEGELSDVSQLCILTLHLESDNQCMRAQLMCRDKACSSLPTYPVALLLFSPVQTLIPSCAYTLVTVTIFINVVNIFRRHMPPCYMVLIDPSILMSPLACAPPLSCPYPAPDDPPLDFCSKFAVPQMPTSAVY